MQIACTCKDATKFKKELQTFRDYELTRQTLTNLIRKLQAIKKTDIGES